MKPVGYQQPTWLCGVHVGLAQLCTENGVSIHMCSAVEVAWLAQNIDIAVHVCDCIYSGV